MTRQEKTKQILQAVEEYLNTPVLERNASQVCSKYHIKRSTMKKYLNKIGEDIVKNHNTRNNAKTIIINKAVDEYIATPKEYRSAIIIAKKYKLNRKTIIRYAKERGFTPTQTHNKGYLDNTVFDCIDTEEKAYWLGFMYADGCIFTDRKNLKNIQLSLSVKDYDHLAKFNVFLKYNRGLVISKNGLNSKQEQLYVVSTKIIDAHLYDALNKLGCCERKSTILEFPQISIFKNNNLIIHFIRGYFDGDGSLGSYMCNKRGLFNSASFVGTKNFLSEIQQILGLHSTLRHKKDKHPNIYKLNYYNDNAIELAAKLYSNSTIYLTRKYNKYLLMCKSPLL